MNEESEEEEYSSIATNDVNYHELVLAGTSTRDELEDKGRKGQKKQADDINKARFGKGGEVIGKWTVCTLAMPMDRNDFTPKKLPVLVCGHNYYKRSKIIRYRLCMENGILKGTYGREQLTPCPDVSPESMGINYNNLDKNNCITQTEAGEMYSDPL
jgi:hypothetical protein